MAPLVECWTLAFSSGQDVKVVKLHPLQGPCSAWSHLEVLSSSPLSTSATTHLKQPALLCSLLSLNQINIIFKKERQF